MKTKATTKKTPDGLYEVYFPDGSKKWYYSKEVADAVKDKFNKVKA